MENVSKFQIKEELRKQWTAQAVELALQGNWDGAVQANQHLIETYPDDVHARNRLGKALSELGRHEEALEVYEQCLKAQPSNNIARKRLAELYALLKREPPAPLGETMPGIEMVEGGDDFEDMDSYLDDEDDSDSADDESGESE